ncbi:MAG: hypothetical protein JST46_06820 [Bacteroidetes bacterium]|nr:hypothetical protein [Bacteroidota bacterium]
MKKDLQHPKVENVTLAVTREKGNLGQWVWKVHLINNNPFDITNTLVSSTGYGEKNGESQKTSTLRHFLETVEAHGSSIVETIDPAVFHLNNEYWVSYYVGDEILDKKFVFLPDSICEENLTFIKELEQEGVLHS